jgi:hypothetical protein
MMRHKEEHVAVRETLDAFKARINLTLSETEVNLLKSNLTDADAKHLVSIINEGRVKRLLLARNSLGDEAACAKAR